MAEEIIEIEQEFIDLAKAEMAKDPALRPCRMCYHFDAEKNYCSHFKQPKMQYNYGAACFITNETALRAMLLQERTRSLRQRRKFNEKLDVMNIMIGGADMIREDVMDMVEKEYRRLVIKAKTDDGVYLKSKRNLQRLQKCYARMKKSMQDFESDYREFIGYWDAQMFADEKGIYNSEYDKQQHNIGYCTYLFFCMFEKLLMSPENAAKLIASMNDLPGQDIWDEGDLKRYLIKI